MGIGKKGSMIDMFFLLVVFVFFSIVILISMYLADQIFPELTGFFGAGTDASNIVATSKGGFAAIDFIFMFLFFTLAGVPILFAVLVKTHPAFIVVNIIMYLVYFAIVPTLSNAVRSFWSEAEFAPYSSGGGGSFTFPVMTALIQYLPYISVIVSSLLMIAMFAKGDEG